MNTLRLTTLALISILFSPQDANAHCDGVKHAGNHPHCDNGGSPPPPPPPPPTGCTDIFPGFLYGHQAQTRKSLGETRLASSDGCRTELVMTEVEETVTGHHHFHMTEDRSKGVIVWSEDPGNSNANYRVRRLDFTVDQSGELHLEEIVTILPLVEGEAVIYSVYDVWGDANHDALYMILQRSHTPLSGLNAGRNVIDILIHDLNNQSERVFYHHVMPIDDSTIEVGEWLDAPDGSLTREQCYAVSYPQFVPTCYDGTAASFNSSGTRLYLSNGLGNFLQDSEVELWHATMRLDIDKITVGPDLADWIIGEPEMVAVVDFRGSGGPEGLKPRPNADSDRYTLPDPEIGATGVEEFLNTDQCAAKYAPFADGNTLLDKEFWRDCLVTYPVDSSGGQFASWESPDTFLFNRLRQKGRGHNIYRMHFSDGMAGTEELLIEYASGGDTGL